jgi:tRNA threonylcarbamoyladenosine biosynthesis protein TsaB
MSLTLALDTATDVASVAVGSGREPLAEVVLTGQRRAAALVPAIEEAVRLAGGAIDDVDCILLADGPGSFTGLRIGAATVQGLVRVRPAIRVAIAPSLLAAAWVASQFHPGVVAALYDALRGDVFAAVVEFEDRGVDWLLRPTLVSAEALARLPVRRPGAVVGDGAAAHPRVAERWAGRPPVVPPLGAPRASALLALEGVPGGTRAIDDIMQFEPDYGRPAEAQVRWERAHGRRLPDSDGHLR